MTTTTLPTTRKEATKQARSRASRRDDLEGTDAFSCPSEPDESMTVNVESFSRIAQMILRAAMDDQGLIPAPLMSTIRNGQTKIVRGRYEVKRITLPIQKPSLLARYEVKRLAKGSQPEKTYTVDVVRVVNATTGAVYEIPMCEADQCGAYANAYGENGDVRFCCHSEAVSLLWEAERDEANREASVLPVAPIASQQTVCPECNGMTEVYDGDDGDWRPTWIPCPVCQFESTEPRRFYDEHDYLPPVSDETFAADWKD